MKKNEVQKNNTKEAAQENNAKNNAPSSQNSIYKQAFPWLLWLVFLSLTFFGVLHHEPWCDEAQAWLITRDLGLWDIIRQLPYEGTPGLWHLLLFPLAKLGLPYATMSWLHWLIAGGAMFIFIFFARLPKIFKVAFALSYFPLYEYAVIARNYSLAILFLFAVAAFYPHRERRPIIYSLIIFGLLQTNILVFVPALFLILLFIVDQWKKEKLGNSALIATTIMLAGAIITFLQVIPYPGQLHGSFLEPRLLSVLSSIGAVFLPIAKEYNEITFFSGWSYLLGGAVIVSLFILTGLLIRARRFLVLYATSASWLLFIFLSKNVGALRHYGFFLIFFIFSWWLSENHQNKTPKSSRRLTVMIAAALMIPGIIISADVYRQEYLYNFSGGKEIAQYIKDNELEQANIISLSSFINLSALPYLPETKFWQPERQEFGTFVTLDYEYVLGSLTGYQEIRRRINSSFYGQEVFLLSSLNLDGYDKSLELVTKNQKPSMSGGFFYLYRLSTLE